MKKVELLYKRGCFFLFFLLLFSNAYSQAFVQGTYKGSDGIDGYIKYSFTFQAGKVTYEVFNNSTVVVGTYRKISEGVLRVEFNDVVKGSVENWSIVSKKYNFEWGENEEGRRYVDISNVESPFRPFFSESRAYLTGPNAYNQSKKKAYDAKKKAEQDLRDLQRQVDVTGSDLKASGSYMGHDFIDLGLSVNWATANAGATSVEQVGKVGDIPSVYKKSLPGWGGNWRLPTAKEVNELIAACKYRNFPYKGIRGCKFTSKKNGNSIFLPYISKGEALYATRSLAASNKMLLCALLVCDNSANSFLPYVIEKNFYEEYAFRYVFDPKAEEKQEINLEEIETIEDIVKGMEERKTEEIVYEVVSQEPQFKGDLAEWIKKNLIYPKAAAKQGIQGRVQVKFIVEKDGSISHATCHRNATGDKSLEAEAIRLVSSMPQWEPAKHDGKIVRAYFMLPITFRLK